MTNNDLHFTVTIKIIPKASNNKIIGYEDEKLKIKINKPPDKNKANIELLKFLSKILKLSISNIEIIKGKTSRIKLLKISNYSKKDFTKSIEKLL